MNTPEQEAYEKGFKAGAAGICWKALNEEIERRDMAGIDKPEASEPTEVKRRLALDSLIGELAIESLGDYIFKGDTSYRLNESQLLRLRDIAFHAGWLRGFAEGQQLSKNPT